MFGTNDPNQMVAGLGVGFLLLVGLWQLITWVREAPTKPDPWDAEVERKLEEPEAVEICHRCFNQQPPNAWFCEHCGSAIGPYNNWMPYLHIFSTGEVLRNGIMDKLRPNVFTISGYLLLSIHFLLLTIIRPHIVFWVLFS